MTPTRLQSVGLVLAAVTLAAGLAVPGTTYSQSREEVGLEIAQDARKREAGFGNYTARQIMLLRNRQGRTDSRKLRVKTLEMSGDGDRILFVFDEPRNVEGTVLLTHSHRDGRDSQWLNLPALKQVKRISSSNRSGSFVGSEFSYEDLGAREVVKFKYRYLGEENCGELRCTIVESVPVEKGSAYSRQVVWRDREELRIRQRTGACAACRKNWACPGTSFIASGAPSA